MRVAAVVLAAVLVGLTPSVAASQSLQPLVVDWLQYFRIESESAARGGRTVVKGTVWNTGPWGAKKIQLLVDALDASGQVVSQRVAWLGIDLASGTHAAFEVPMPPSASYRVSVFAFDSGRGGRWS
jgi:hypothetical protein